MFNGNFMNKVRTSNVGGDSGKFNTYNQYDLNSTQRDDGPAAFATNSRIGTTNSDQTQLFNMVNQNRKTPNASSGQGQMMMTTQFFNSTQNSVVTGLGQRQGNK